VEFSLNRALSLAQIEAEEGVESTYFIRTRGDGYSLLEATQKNLIHSIMQLGHNIGLHLEVSDNPIETIGDLEDCLARDKKLIESELGVTISCFSFHNPTDEMLSFSADTYMGLNNVYAKRYFSEVAYASDSNGYWRFQPLSEVLVDPSITRLQVLTHPEWWVPQAISPFERVKRAAEGRASALLLRYEDEIIKSGRENIR
jgi:hypothetical protein